MIIVENSLSSDLIDSTRSKLDELKSVVRFNQRNTKQTFTTSATPMLSDHSPSDSEEYLEPTP
jgi:hypothetical protein